MPFFEEIIHLDPSEAIAATYRAHMSVLLMILMPLSLALFILFLFVVPLIALGLWGILVFVFFVLVLSFFILGSLIRWMGTITVLTTRRIIAIRRLDLLKKSVKEHTLDTITEISYTSKGVLQTACHLGDIHITALYTGVNHTIAANIAQPQLVLDQISGCVSRYCKSRTVSIEDRLSVNRESSDTGDMRPALISVEQEDKRDVSNWQ